MDFGRVLGRLWEAKIHNFRIFGHVFSKEIDAYIFGGEQRRKKVNDRHIIEEEPFVLKQSRGKVSVPNVKSFFTNDSFDILRCRSYTPHFRQFLSDFVQPCNMVP